VSNTLKKLLCGNRETNRLKDEKGNPVSFSRLLRNGPKALVTFIGRRIFDIRPQVPWISYDARCMLARILPCDSDVLEFGSGNSTLWYARQFRTVFSVEDHEHWYACVQLMLSRRRLSNVHHYLHNAESYAWFGEAATRQFDLVMIDGSIRSACVMTALVRIKADAIIYLDNSDKHPRSGDTRLAEEALLAAAYERGGCVRYFTDFAPTDFFVNQGMMVLFGRFAKAV
jgi:hypothetical protein